MKLYTLALVGVLGVFGVSAEAQTCGVLCDPGFWKSASEADIVREISTADVHARSEDGQTALIWAAGSGTAESVKLLLDAGADVHARNKFSSTALMWAAGSGTAENVKVLLDSGADGSVKDSKGKTAWDLAQDNATLKGTDAYWMLNDARFK